MRQNIYDIYDIYLETKHSQTIIFQLNFRSAFQADMSVFIISHIFICDMSLILNRANS